MGQHDMTTNSVKVAHLPKSRFGRSNSRKRAISSTKRSAAAVTNKQEFRQRGNTQKPRIYLITRAAAFFRPAREPMPALLRARPT